ncbi:electron transport complex subunit RsxC [uncultured Buchnera sp.]|uniref:electron transport complex subunit RsxC n=1 Tax=uncultured Buchnera sp. TaxID=574037 RepID=UPI0025F3CC56|nr:electron transport complex subunit RsxC [uncultured Buchnera sp.]
MKKKYNFKGGIQCISIKKDPREYFLNYLPHPEKFFIYIEYSHFKKNRLRVKVGQEVLCGQPLTFGNNLIVPVHSPTSGWIKNIYFNPKSSDKNPEKIKIVILSNHLNKWIRLKTIKNYKKYTPKNLIKIIYQSGIVGLGGAQFPSFKKLMLSINKVHTLIVNGIESEPCITADYCLMQNYIDEILIGCEIIAWISKVKDILIVIQEDKTELILKIQKIIENKQLFKLCIIKKKYPGGSSKILIKSLTGKEIPYGKHSIDIGYLIFNVATIYAIKRSIINGEPLIKRIITVYNKDKNILSKNFWVKIGTPVHFLLNYLKIDSNLNTLIYSGGVFMRYLIVNLNYSIQKNMNCIYIKNNKKNKKKIEYPCINCGYCVNACPVNLLPQEMFLYCKNSNNQKLKQLNILDCIECKICEKVCPSNIPLVKYFRIGKKIQKNIDIENNRKKLFSSLFRKREKRLLIEKKISYSKDQISNIKKLDIFSKIQEKEENSSINQKIIEKSLRKEMLKEAIKRAKLRR